ncbi:DUF4362 domain-containing protein [Paenibacillus sp. sptzw28]|uniref:DUF4362 domain-containing protein n=1 Tax=Paenibacillus sp. sptzw28 TaxID=715179 RepID=UPI001C6EA982|nr:DUF4362 domain-containing protein [Paenibacillus sp. sptzw28]QYR21237.1 DUF4362 domain-containing protein [Paenibacillus sp. sptzw28]
MRKKYLLFVSMIMLTACSLFSNHSDLTFHEAEKAGYVVSGPGGLSGIRKLEEFHQNVQNKLKSQVSIAQYTDEGDPIYTDLDFNGEAIKYTYDNSWDAFGGQGKGVRTATCKAIIKRTGPYGEANGTVYLLSQCNRDIGYSDPDRKEYFLLFVPQMQ